MTLKQFQHIVVFWLGLIYRGLIRIERKLDKFLEQQEDQAQLLKLSRTLQEATDRLQRAMDNQK